MQALSRLSRVLGPEQAKREWRWMLQSVRGGGDIDKVDSVDRNDTVDRISNETLSAMVARRVQGEPLQYILGTQPFGPLDLMTRPPVLIPRPETEDWAIRLAAHLKPTVRAPIRVLDLCTGSGCIPLLLCKTWPSGTARALGIDISSQAIQLAEDNAKRCGIPASSDSSASHTPATTTGQGAHNTFNALQADMRDPNFVSTLKSSVLQPPFDVITSNPPYIPKHEYEQLPASVKDYEDIRALLGDPDLLPRHRTEIPPSKPLSDSGRGLTFYHKIAELVANEHEGLLAANGVLAVEVGHGQAHDVAAIMKEEGNLHNISIWKDPWDVDRVVVASRK